MNNVKDLRLAKNLTQQQVANAAKVSLNCYVAAERKGSLPWSIEGMAIAKVLGVKVSWKSRLKRGPVGVVRPVDMSGPILKSKPSVQEAP